MSAPVKRFIAGAVCPGCGAMDRIKAWVEDGVAHRECVACGFADRASAEPGKLPPTRLERPAQPTAATLKFYPRKGGDKKPE